MLLQPVATALLLTPARLLSRVLFMQSRRGIPALPLTRVPPTLMNVLVPVLLLNLPFGCRQAYGLTPACVLTRDLRMWECLIMVFLLMAVLTRAAHGLMTVLLLIIARFRRKELGRTAVLWLTRILLLT